MLSGGDFGVAQYGRGYAVLKDRSSHDFSNIEFALQYLPVAHDGQRHVFLRDLSSRYLQSRNEVLRTARHNRPLSLLLLDVDRFKVVNDQFGHLGGDFTLRELAGCIKKVLRREDLFARYGGEEFAIILIETGHDDAMIAAERIRTLVENHTFRFDDKVFQLTISLGVAECPLDGTATPRELIRRADENLYAAKRAGRNRVVG